MKIAYRPRQGDVLLFTADQMPPMKVGETGVYLQQKTGRRESQRLN